MKLAILEDNELQVVLNALESVIEGLECEDLTTGERKALDQASELYDKLNTEEEV